MVALSVALYFVMLAALAVRERLIRFTRTR
jgi:hypothetical protein